MARHRLPYRDQWIICGDHHLIILGYRFPFGNPKIIDYDDIRSVTRVEMGLFTGRGRLWGTTSPHLWAHLDLRRPWKHEALVIDLGSSVKPFITPDDPDQVQRIIEEKMAG